MDLCTWLPFPITDSDTMLNFTHLAPGKLIHRKYLAVKKLLLQIYLIKTQLSFNDLNNKLAVAIDKKPQLCTHIFSLQIIFSL